MELGEYLWAFENLATKRTEIRKKGKSEKSKAEKNENKSDGKRTKYHCIISERKDDSYVIK